MNTKQIFLLYTILISLSFMEENYRCNYCFGEITANSIQYKNKIFHENCYNENIRPSCEKCHLKIESEYKIYQNNKFHPMCYKNIKFPKCNICYEKIKDKYYQDLWGNIIHERHIHDSNICFYCNRIISQGLTNGGYAIEDGRNICSLCESESILSIEEIEDSRIFVLSELKKSGFNNLPDNVKIVMVDHKKLLLYSGNLLPGIIDLPKIKGYTKSFDNDFVIYIVNHTPKIEFEAILAHEYLHIWQILNNINLDKNRSEGVSSIGNYIIYKAYNNEYSNAKLAIMNSDDYIYKEGFSKYKNSINNDSLKKIIKNLLLR